MTSRWMHWTQPCGMRTIRDLLAVISFATKQQYQATVGHNQYGSEMARRSTCMADWGPKNRRLIN